MEKYQTIATIKELDELKATKDAFLLYFSHEKCNVCKVLKPKIEELIKEKYPKIEMYYVDTEHSQEIAGQNSIFAIPTILVFLGGREYIRKSRNIGIAELSEAIQRPYSMIFR